MTATAPQHVRIDGTDIQFTVEPDETILHAATRQKINFPSLCNVGECGSCRCRLKSGQVRLKSDVSRHIDDDALIRGDILACQSKLISSISLNVPTLSPEGDGAEVETKKLDATVTSVVYMSADMIELTLKLDKSLNYHAGQYALLFAANHPILRTDARSYSFATGPHASNTNIVKFHIKKVANGLFTEWLFEKDRTGEIIHLEGPFGSFTWSEPKADVLLIAGGSGYAPINALLVSAGQYGPLNATLFYGVKTQQDIYCEGFVTSIQANWEGTFNFIPVLSAERPDSSWSGLRGRIPEQLHKHCNDLSTYSAYLCGPPEMVDACLKELRPSIEDNHVHYDKFLNRSHFSSLTTG